MTEVVAFYLPQFHEVKENNEWWGEGFTEWTNVKNARKFFKGHIQPRVPINNNYYNLMDKRTVEWQTKLASDYGIDCFAYYHYWFEGDMLLEKPIENLLGWKDIPQRFFFFWANHTWYKSSKKDKIVLKEQKYGGVEDWNNHYNYFLKFFSDSRYVKNNNKPLVGIFRANMIPNYSNMIDYWNKRAIQDGFNGIEVIECLNNCNEQLKDENSYALLRSPDFVSSTIKEPFYHNFFDRLFRRLKRPLKPYITDTNFFRKKERNIAEKYSNVYKKTILCMCSGWDNTPRHGKYGGVFINQSKENFKQTFDCLYKKAIELNQQYVFINAWNEWAEGMILEPDEEFEYSFLEAIKEVKNS